MTQDEAFEVLKMGKHVFLTGAAGTGKTYVLNRFIKWLRARGIEPAVTASTGIAATHIGGQTIHSWSGIGVKDYLGPYELDRIEQNERLVKRFLATKVLVIDEVSMLSANTLALVDQAMRAGLRSTEPFGGVQVVLCGDFFQLPPVTRGGNANFAFQGEVWHELGLHVCYLEKQYRQDDETLLGVLNAIRAGEIRAPQREALEARVGVQVPDNVPHLFTHNVDVDGLNNERLAALKGGVRNFNMTTKGGKKYLEILKRGLLVSETLQLKKDAAVMFVKNDPHGKYVNGTLGVVTGFSASNDPIVETRDGQTIFAEPQSWSIEEGDKVRAEVTQVPLRLAWAVTVHKSQGMTLDAARADLSKTFVQGQGYVALSRVRTLDGLYLDGLNDMVYSRHPAVAEADAFLRATSHKVVRRLAKTPPERLQELVRESMVRKGGSEPDPKNPRPGIQKKTSTYEKTRVLLLEHASIADMATERGVTEQTIVAHLEKLLQSKDITVDDIQYLLAMVEGFDEVLEEVRDAFAQEDGWGLSTVRTRLKNKYSFEELRFARLFVRE